MAKCALMRIIFSVALLFTASWLLAQDCSDPKKLCANGETQQITTSSGDQLALPGGYCFDLAKNVVYTSFETLDLVQFPQLTFEDSATLSVAGLNCYPDPDYGQGILLAVFTATDLCDPGTYSSPVVCDTLYQSAEIFLNDLQPSTTYHVLIGTFDGGDPPATYPGDCQMTLSVSGPAVTYDLQPNWSPSSNGILLTGQTLTLEANKHLYGYTWTGEALNENTGWQVTANPQGDNKNLQYIVEVTINGCYYNEVITVPILPAIMPYNAFTPNGDGMNDTWKIDRITEWPNAQIYVYSRWGTKVFQTINYQNDWGGDDLPAATYYYIIELNPLDFNIEPYTGSVTIIR